MAGFYKIFLGTGLLLAQSFTSPGGHERPAAASHFTKARYQELPLGAIKPAGWLYDQLQTMKSGTSGHLDEVYTKLKNENGWLGGRGDGWEETPYWLDGALPLAWQLDDKKLKVKVLVYINWLLSHQRPSGYFGPLTASERKSGLPISKSTAAEGEDWWPKMVMLKVMQQYYSASNDPRVLVFFQKYFRYQLDVLQNEPLGKWSEWAESRGSENILVVQWLYSMTHEPWLLTLASTLESQSYPWSTWFGGRDWVIDAATQQNDQNWMHRHGVNVAMGLKVPALNFQRTGDSVFLKDLHTGFSDLMSLHGLPMGMFSADEDLHGNLPTQGTELCAIVESMFSLEQIIAITGKVEYMDALEKMTFNALPAQTSDDYNEKQYFQIPNQVTVARGVFNFSLPFDRGMNNVLGMRSGYTCCLANMHQGWPKFIQHLWYKTKNNGLAALMYGPNELKTTAGPANTPVTITESTDYPFNESIEFTVSTKKTASFSLQFRIPIWCIAATLTINGKREKDPRAGTLVQLGRVWETGDKIVLRLPMPMRTTNWGRNSRAVERGPLVYALKLKEEFATETDEKEGEYQTVSTPQAWNYGLQEQIITSPAQFLSISVKPLNGHFIWNQAHSPLEISATGRKIENWKLNEGIASQPVTDRNGLYKGRVSDSVFQLKLIPYGFTKVRITAFPVVR